MPPLGARYPTSRTTAGTTCSPRCPARSRRAGAGCAACSWGVVGVLAVLALVLYLVPYEYAYVAGDDAVNPEVAHAPPAFDLWGRSISAAEADRSTPCRRGRTRWPRRPR